MPLRAQYLADIGLHSNPYPHHPESRIRKMYGTSRRGSISYDFAREIWNEHLKPLHGRVVSGVLPGSQVDYDNLIVTEALGVEVLLSASRKGGFGIAQKIVNLFMKDLWGFEVIGMPSEKYLHAPVDRRVLGKFSDVNTDWNPWTKALAGSPSCATITSYLGMQKQLRDLWSTSPIQFPSVIQMEQFLWHPIS